MRRHVVKFSPLHVINPALPSVQFAYEYRFAEKFSVQLEAGYVFNGGYWTWNTKRGVGVKLKEELRWYFHQKKLMTRQGDILEKGVYLAAELHQHRINFTDESENLYRQDGKGLKIGYARYGRGGFVVDVSAGIAFARSNLEPVGLAFSGSDLRPYGYKIVLPTGGFRIGYVF